MRRLALATLVALVPGTALAANQLHPRTPALFEDTPCLITIDKAVDDLIFHIDYAVPYDDAMLTPEELLDSRRMQFFAFSEQHWDFRVPVWITQADYDRALANGDITLMYTDDDILEKTTLWSLDSWVRITADDARVPITMDQAAMGVDWDITEVPRGTWMIAAYTWEPELNLWSHRLGAVRIEDSSMSAEPQGPSLFLQDAPSSTAEVETEYTVVGCIHADAGSTYSASYGPLDGIAEPTWVPFMTEAPVVNGELAIPFVPPAMLAGSAVKVRVDVQSPSGSFTAYTPRPIDVTCLECGEGSSGEVETDTGDSSGTFDPTDGTTTTGENGENGEEGEGGGGFGFGGGGCRTSEPAPVGAALFLLLLGLSPRVRRRC